MSNKTINDSKKLVGIVVLSVLVVAVTIAGLKYRSDQKIPDGVSDTELKKIIPAESSKAVMDYNNLEKDKALSSLMQERKAKYGIDTGVDMIVKSDESLRVGDTTVSMEEILDETRLQRGELIEKDMGDSTEKKNAKTTDFGIHVVLPGENIWNIHFNLLKNRFDNLQITISPIADEPGKNGQSSGVGKILKFSEKMVYIYNLEERKLASDINLIQPLTKIVVYHMDEVFSLIDQIDFKNVNQIQFDGDTLWMPQEQ
ncbi:MAG: hypothetical protein JRI61_01080 [Deltaproteobacteria bacterium]|nr:hypothetical protein [Deltaproteobacteria bacterium]